MEMISVRLPSKLRAKIATEAWRRNVSRSTIVRESRERAFGGPSSRADLAATWSELSGAADAISLPTKNCSLMRSLRTNVVAASVTVDTGPIVVLLDADDQQHT
jgi:hypothetical protein